MKRPRLFLALSAVGPGFLVAATGVGAGDLATGAFTGSKLGVAVLWAVLLGAFLKFVLNEGLTRWQLATGDTLLEGAVRHLGRGVQIVFFIYLILWSFVVGAALISACGVATHGIIPLFRDAKTAKIVFGIVSSLLGITLVVMGGFQLFEKVMNVCVGIMFATVISTACLICKDWTGVIQGICIPGVPDAGLAWTVALMGGVGGTLTVLCYGYWIREKGRLGLDSLKTCRIDLGVAYMATALFGIAMVVIGSQIPAGGKGAGLILQLADKLEGPLGKPGRWLFLLGAWSAIFSSLLGVWQSVPYLFADFCALVKKDRTNKTGGRLSGTTAQQEAQPSTKDGSPEESPNPTVAASTRIDTRGKAYRGYLLGIGLVPMIALFVDFTRVQKTYAIFGALFMPMLAAALLILNGRTRWVGRSKNKPTTVGVLVATLLLFVFFGFLMLKEKFHF